MGLISWSLPLVRLSEWLVHRLCRYTGLNIGLYIVFEVLQRNAEKGITSLNLNIVTVLLFLSSYLLFSLLPGIQHHAAVSYLGYSCTEQNDVSPVFCCTLSCLPMNGNEVGR